MDDVPDRIVQEAVLLAPREQVWHAISEADRFGAWFGVAFEGEFAAGKTLRATIQPTQVDPAVAAMQEPHRGMPFTFVVERIAPMDEIAFRWHPYAIDQGHDYSDEPTTLIVFRLDDAGGTTWLTITEPGFHAIPAARRAEAYAKNTGGWAMQAKLLAKYLAQDS